MIGLGVAKLFVSFHVASWDRADYRPLRHIEMGMPAPLLAPSCGWGRFEF
ncbi:hypothetical protein ACVWZV_008469 [Bradyrhizobium sp. GM5.1]